jgi:hypothetical protein
MVLEQIDWIQLSVKSSYDVIFMGLGLVWSSSSTIWVHLGFRVSSGILIHDSSYCFATMVFCSFCLGPVCECL